MPRPSARRLPAGAAPRLAYQADPLGATVRRLGSKWTLLLLRDMAFLRLARFGELLRNNPGLTPRVLSRRLREMAAEGLVVRTGAGQRIRYDLTRRGEDAVFILLAFLRYGLRYHPLPGSALGVDGTDSAPPAVTPPRSTPTPRARRANGPSPSAQGTPVGAGSDPASAPSSRSGTRPPRGRAPAARPTGD